MYKNVENGLGILEAISRTPAKSPLRKHFHKYEVSPTDTGIPHIKTNATHGLSDKPFIFSI